MGEADPGRGSRGCRFRRAGVLLGVGVLLLVASACQSQVIQSAECFNGSATVQATTPSGVVHPGDTIVVSYHFTHEGVTGLTDFPGQESADLTLPAGLSEGPASSHV